VVHANAARKSSGSRPDCQRLRRETIAGRALGTFPLTDEPFDEPPEHLEAAVRGKSLEDTRFTAMRPGDTWTPIQNVSLPVPA
jgi:hypothetical protein